MSAELGSSAQVTQEERIYGAHVASLLELIRELPASVRAPLVVGHDPGVRDLTVTLAAAGSEGQPDEALARVREKFPTGAAAVLEVPVAWPDLGVGTARLADFVAPRDLEK